MTNYLEFPLENGGYIVLEVEESEEALRTGGLIQASNTTDKILAKVDNTFESAIENVREGADILLNKLRSLHESPDEIEVTFGLKASGELGGTFLVAKAGMEANYTVKLKWTKDG